MFQLFMFGAGCFIAGGMVDTMGREGTTPSSLVFLLCTIILAVGFGAAVHSQ